MSMNSRISYINLGDATVEDKNKYKFKYNVLDVVGDSSAVIIELDAHRSVVCAIAEYDEMKKTAILVGGTCVNGIKIKHVIGKVTMQEIELMMIDA